MQNAFDSGKILASATHRGLDSADRRVGTVSDIVCVSEDPAEIDKVSMRQQILLSVEVTGSAGKHKAISRRKVNDDN